MQVWQGPTADFKEEYSLSISIAVSLDDENANRRGEVEGRKRRNTEAMPRPNRWNKDPWGWRRRLIEVEACRLRPEG
jgi:hypothetical protein